MIATFIGCITINVFIFAGNKCLDMVKSNACMKKNVRKYSTFSQFIHTLIYLFIYFDVSMFLCCKISSLDIRTRVLYILFKMSIFYKSIVVLTFHNAKKFTEHTSKTFRFFFFCSKHNKFFIGFFNACAFMLNKPYLQSFMLQRNLGS